MQAYYAPLRDAIASVLSANQNTGEVSPLNSPDDKLGACLQFSAILKPFAYHLSSRGNCGGGQTPPDTTANAVR